VPDVAYAVTPSHAFLFPLAVAACAAAFLPPGHGPEWDRQVWRLRYAGAALVLLSPFLVWWWYSETSAYLAAAGGLASAVAVWFHAELTRLTEFVAEAMGDRRLAKHARRVRLLLLYLTLAPLLALHASSLVFGAAGGRYGPAELRQLYFAVPWLHLVMVLPPGAVVLLLLAVRRRIMVRLCAPDRRPPVPSASPPVCGRAECG
jgi:hypothetical protein